jgi:hypothetical protein
MDKILFKAFYDHKTWQVVAIDWDDRGNIITAHLKRKDEVRKVYPNDEFGDKVVFRQYTGENDAFDVKIFNGDIVKDKKGNCYQVHLDSGGVYLENKKGEYVPLVPERFGIIGNVYEHEDFEKSKPKVTDNRLFENV